MFREALKKLDAEVSSKRLAGLVEEVWRSDRLYTSPGFERTMKLCARRMEEAGLRSECGSAAADGKTLVIECESGRLRQPGAQMSEQAPTCATGSPGRTRRKSDWMMPLAWDAERGRLDLVSPESRKLIEYPETNTALVMWSGPTPPGGVTAELVWLAAAGRDESYGGGDLSGKVLLTDARASAVKGCASKHGAIGVVSFYLPRPDDQPDGVFWNNAFSDSPGGWGSLASDSRIFGFGVSPREGRALRALCGKGRVLVKAEVLSRLYEGRLPWATGLLAGSTGEEVMAVGHACEQGANDNASGVAAMIEAARAISELVRRGELPAPRRGVRVVVISECYGLLAFAAANRRILKRTVAATNLDCVGEKQPECLMPLPIHLNAHSSAFFGDSLAKAVADGCLPGRNPFYAYKVVRGHVGLGDSMYSDPAIGVPCLYVGGIDRYWHTCADTIDKVDPEALKLVSTMTAAWLYFIASAGTKEALWMAQMSAADGVAELAELGAAEASGVLAGGMDAAGAAKELASAREKLEYTAWWRANEALSARRLIPPPERKAASKVLASLRSRLNAAAREELRRVRSAAEYAAGGEVAEVEREKASWEAEAAGLVPVRKFFGSLTFDSIPPAEREGRPSPRWDSVANAAVFWCDGRRSLAEVIRLTRLQTGSGGEELVKLFRFLERHGLMELRPAGPPAA